MKRTVKSAVVVLIFIIFLVVPVLTINWSGADYSESEKRNLAPMPVVFAETGELNSNFAGEAKLWLEDHIGLRSHMVEAIGWFKLHFMNSSPSESVHLGKDDWLFYTKDNNMEIATGSFPLTDDMLQQMLRNMVRIQERLEHRGTEFVLVLPPSKVSVYPEYLRYGSGKVVHTPVDIVADFLEANSDLKIVRLKESLLEAKDDQQVYYAADTHWNEAGAYVAYETIIQDLQRWGLCNSAPAPVALEEGSHVCDLTLMMGQTTPEQTLKTKLIDPRAIKHGEDSLRYQQAKELAGKSTVYLYSNDSAEETTGLFFGDSMFGSWNATELMAENFSEFTYVWNYNIREDIVEMLDPDVVFLEMTERGIQGLATIQFDYLQESFPVTEVEFAYEADVVGDGGKICVTTTGNSDPQIVLKAFEAPVNPMSLELKISNVDKPCNLQVYYAAEIGGFSEENSIHFTIIPEQDVYFITGFNLSSIRQLRIDFENEKDVTYQLERIVLNGVS